MLAVPGRGPLVKGLRLRAQELARLAQERCCSCSPGEDAHHASTGVPGGASSGQLDELVARVSSASTSGASHYGSWDPTASRPGNPPGHNSSTTDVGGDGRGTRAATYLEPERGSALEEEEEGPSQEGPIQGRCPEDL